MPPSSAGPTTTILELPSGIRVGVTQQGGTRAPAVVCLPGWGGSQYLFRHNIPALASAGFRAIAIDLKGHGVSDKPLDTDDYTLDGMVAHVLEVLDALHLEKASLIGQSMAGPIAAQISLTAFERVERLVLLAPVGYGPIRPVSIARVLAPLGVARHLPALATRWMFDLVVKSMYGDLIKPSERDIDEYFAPASDPNFVRALHRLIHHFDWSSFDDGRLRALRVPLLVIRGDSDPIVPLSVLDRFRQDVPGLRVAKIPRAGHLLTEEAPEAVNRAIVDFLSAPNLQPG
ncbi:MAG: alpha/beta hydrolase [Anaerolineae bacterium]|nr:alpha/beta hydrolase [Gemmatimonadaceae bacterium]